jgi:hypothetical protein
MEFDDVFLTSYGRLAGLDSEVAAEATGAEAAPAGEDFHQSGTRPVKSWAVAEEVAAVGAYMPENKQRTIEMHVGENT